MLLTLLKALDTTDLQKVVANISLAPLDIDLMLYDAQESKQIKIDKKKDTIKALGEPERYYDAELAKKLAAIIRRYDEQEANITFNRLQELALGMGGLWGYRAHDFVCSLYALEQGWTDLPKVNKYEISVPEIKNKRPANTFVFYTFFDHQEFGAKAVNAFIDEWQKIIIAENKKR